MLLLKGIITQFEVKMLKITKNLNAGDLDTQFCFLFVFLNQSTFPGDYNCCYLTGIMKYIFSKIK